MRTPSVSFVVPCFKLAHLLADCLSSILRQSYVDFEILVMDDCSPDDTAAVVRAFDDPRIRYIRNERNLGHLRNYNAGLSQCTGKFVWLISADDYLRTTTVLERYVEILEQHPAVGYVFCPGYTVRNGRETQLLGRYSERRDRDRIFSGRAFLSRLLESNFVITPSVLVRRECYERVSVFDLKMPWCGDWYLWCAFALHFDVAYCAEPMVCYREHHDLSMTTKLTTEKLDACAEEEIAVPWKIRELALKKGDMRTARRCLTAATRTYARTLASKQYRGSATFMNFERCRESIEMHVGSKTDVDRMWPVLLADVGNEYYWQGESALARKYYAKALRANPWKLTAWGKALLLASGKSGDYVRRAILAYR